MERRLAAIVAADLVGYTRLMATDEAGTLARLKALRTSLLEPLVAEHHGRVIKVMGDGLLVEFASIVDAGTCAMAWQKAVAEHESEQDAESRLCFRISVNLGDVIVEGEDLYGDGVNIAARLESLAEPGGICLSDDVYRQLRGKIEARFEDMGDRELKNVPQPVRVYRIAGDGASALTSSRPILPLRVPGKPSIAVLPFVNMSGDPEQEYFADGVTEDIITALSHVQWLFVIARNSTFVFKGKAVDIKGVSRELGVRYVLEGSIRRSGDRVRVTGQLIDGINGNHVWAQRYDRVLSDVFEVQDELTATIVGAIEPELNRAERERAKSKRPENVDAWDIYQRGMSHLYRYTKDDLSEARRLFAQSMASSPEFSLPYSGLAEAYYYEVVYGFADRPDESRRIALDPAQRAVELDLGDAGAHCTLGRIHYLRREYAPAVRELQTAIELNPSLALAHYGLGAALVFSGHPLDARPHLEQAIRLSPRDPNMGSFLVRLADASYFTGDYEGAVDWAEKALGQPNFQWSRYAMLLAALGQLGRTDQAKHYIDQVLSKRADFSVEFVQASHLFGDPGKFDHFLDGLKRAGLM
jgi:adenylate cyclase